MSRWSLVICATVWGLAGALLCMSGCRVAREQTGGTQGSQPGKGGCGPEALAQAIMGNVIDPAPRQPVFSPDGTKLAFVVDSGKRARLWVLDCATGVLSAPATDQGDQLAPNWHPSGASLAYELHADGRSEIRSVDLTTGATTRLVDHFGDETSPSWSPDGSRVGFLRATQSGGQAEPMYSALIAEPSAGAERMLEPPPSTSSWEARANWDPRSECVWSPSGAYVAVAAHAYAGYRVFDARGELLTEAPDAGLPSWSPKGTRVAAWVRKPALGSSIEDHLEVRETPDWRTHECSDAEVFFSRAWSWNPAGNALVSGTFGGAPDQREFESFDGLAGLVLATPGPPLSESAVYQSGWSLWHPQFSPTGDRMTYIRSTDRAADRDSQGLWLADSTGIPLHLLMPTSMALTMLDAEPRRAWSRDGRWIAALDTPDHQGMFPSAVDTFLVDVEGGTVENLCDRARAQGASGGG